MSRRIVFIHGMFMNPKSWAPWVERFSARGYTAEAPPWPLHEGEPAVLRQSPPEGLGALTLGDVIAHYERLLAGTEPAILVGHSMGGLIVQRLIAMGLGACGVCIDSAPPKGVVSLKWSFLRSNLPVINPFAGSSPYQMTREHFRYTFCNMMPPEASDEAWERLVVPESRDVARSSSGPAGRIDFTQPHAPLLFIAGERDHIIPASLVRSNAARYAHAGSRVDLREFPGRGHFLCGQPGWEEIADHVESWLDVVAPTASLAGDGGTP